MSVLRLVAGLLLVTSLLACGTAREQPNPSSAPIARDADKSEEVMAKEVAIDHIIGLFSKEQGRPFDPSIEGGYLSITITRMGLKHNKPITGADIVSGIPEESNFIHIGWTQRHPIGTDLHPRSGQYVPLYGVVFGQARVWNISAETSAVGRPDSDENGNTETVAEISVKYSVGYRGVLSFDHEDPMFPNIVVTHAPFTPMREEQHRVGVIKTQAGWSAGLATRNSVQFPLDVMINYNEYFNSPGEKRRCPPPNGCLLNDNLIKELVP